MTMKRTLIGSIILAFALVTSTGCGGAVYTSRPMARSAKSNHEGKSHKSNKQHKSGKSQLRTQAHFVLRKFGAKLSSACWRTP